MSNSTNDPMSRSVSVSSSRLRGFGVIPDVAKSPSTEEPPLGMLLSVRNLSVCSGKVLLFLAASVKSTGNAAAVVPSTGEQPEANVLWEVLLTWEVPYRVGLPPGLTNTDLCRRDMLLLGLESIVLDKVEASGAKPLEETFIAKFFPSTIKTQLVHIIIHNPLPWYQMNWHFRCCYHQ